MSFLKIGIKSNNLFLLFEDKNNELLLRFIFLAALHVYIYIFNLKCIFSFYAGAYIYVDQTYKTP